MASKQLMKIASNRKLSGFLKVNRIFFKHLENGSCWDGPFCFIQGADTQFGMFDSYIFKKPVVGWERELKLTRTAIEAVNAMSPKPRFFIVCGDLIHAFPGEKYRTAQEDDFIEIFKELHPDIPLVCVCGNHDVGNTPTPEAIETYQKRFGDDYFTFFSGGVMFIVLNSQFFEDPSLVQDLAAKHEAWLNEQLEEAKTGKYKHVIMFQHIPWFLNTPDEEKCYFNILPELRQKWLQKFHDANIRAIFCGHWHGNAGGFYKNLEVVVTSAIGAQLRKDNSGFRVVSCLENQIKHTYYDLGSVPEKIVLE